jgi:hypothetical protein
MFLYFLLIFKACAKYIQTFVSHVILNAFLALLI